MRSFSFASFPPSVSSARFFLFFFAFSIAVPVAKKMIVFEKKKKNKEKARNTLYRRRVSTVGYFRLYLANRSIFVVLIATKEICGFKIQSKSY